MAISRLVYDSLNKKSMQFYINLEKTLILHETCNILWIICGEERVIIMTMIGNKIRKRRQELNMSRAQLAEEVQVTPSAIANYENGISYPKPDIFVSLMVVLEVDANYFYEEHVRNREIARACKRPISQDEIDALEKYRKLTSSGKKLVRMVIEEEYTRMQREAWISFPCVKDEGKGLNTLCKKNAEYFEFYVRKENIIDGMEFCLQIQTDKYEPIFRKGDVIALTEKKAGQNEIGIFSVNGVYYLRLLYQEQGVRKLKALNVLEQDIEVEAKDQFICMGTVLGKVQGMSDV